MRNPLATVLEKTYGPLPKPDDIHVLALVKGAERYLLLCDDVTIPDALRTLGRWASDSTLSFNWYDCALLSQKLRARHK